jgi:hypothetical protein
MPQNLELLTEIDLTIAELEKSIPASPARNANIESALRRELANYFKSLEDGIDWNALEQLYYKLVRE